MTRLRAVAAPLLAVCLLSACTSDTTKTTSPPPSPTQPPTSASASPSPKPSAAPIPTKTGPVTPDLATLKAAATAYFKAHDDAIRTRDTKAFRRTFTERCRICAADVADLDGYTRLGQSLQGGEHRISSPSLLKVSPGGGILIVSIHQNPSTLVDASGKTVKTFEASDVPRAYLEFSLINQKWIAVGSVVG